jgi:penicillin-binding protein 1C
LTSNAVPAESSVAARGGRSWKRFAIRAASAAAVIAAGVTWLRLGPLPPGLLDVSRMESTVVVDRGGEVLYEARGADGGRNIRLSPVALPRYLVDATLAAEDRRFWTHPGVDPIAVLRAALHDVRRRRLAEGGSTITQQVAKLLLARQAGIAPDSLEVLRRGWTAKLREAVVAVRLEHRLSKAEILALYLNLASYGNQLVGAERASREYFGISSDSTTPAQAAFLAALPQRPTTFNPYRSMARATTRQQYILRSMVIDKSLSVDEGARALAERLEVRREPSAFGAPHFVQRVLADADAARSAGVNSQGRAGRIVTTLDAGLQREVEGIIRSQRLELERHGAHNVAVVVLDNTRGEWLAWEGSGSSLSAGAGGAIDGAATPRQPGSALKPLIYALAFERGESPTTVLPDVPSYFPTSEPGVLYSPSNYDNRFRGPLLARRALAGSENVPAVLMASRLGVPDVLRFLRGAGLTTFDKNSSYYGLGIALGDAEVRLDELVTAYAAFARGGISVTPALVRSPGGRPRGERLMSERTAFWITDILSDADAREYAFGRGTSLDFPFAVAAKTGTSQAYRDNWTIGFTKGVTVGVWVGNFDRTPLVGSSGVTGAGPIFHAVMTAAVRRMTGGLSFDRDVPTEARPHSVERRRICALSGMAAGPWCPETEEWVATEAPATPCSWHRRGLHGPEVEWPSEYHAWAQTRGLLPAADRPVIARAVPVANRESSGGIRVASPPPGAVYLIDPSLRREFQTIALRAASDTGGTIEWRVDGRRVGASAAETALDWPLASGAHVIEARDRRGSRAASSILVK